MKALVYSLTLAATLAASDAAAKVVPLALPDLVGITEVKGYAKAGKGHGKGPSVTFSKPAPRTKGRGPTAGSKITGPNRPRLPRPWPPQPTPKPKPTKPAKGDPPPKRPLTPPLPKWTPPGI